jgi:hypothetical protein
MPRRDDLDFDAWITVHRRHPISCDVHCEEAQFRLGPNGGSLVLCFTWTALTKFLRVAHEAVTLFGKCGSSAGGSCTRCPSGTRPVRCRSVLAY